MQNFHQVIDYSEIQAQLKAETMKFSQNISVRTFEDETLEAKTSNFIENFEEYSEAPAEKKEELDEESDDDMGFGLFD